MQEWLGEKKDIQYTSHMNAGLCAGRMNWVVRATSRPGPGTPLKAARSASQRFRHARAGSASGVAGHAAVQCLASAPGDSGVQHVCQQYAMSTFPWSLSFFQISSFHDQNKKTDQRRLSAGALGAPAWGSR